MSNYVQDNLPLDKLSQTQNLYPKENRIQGSYLEQEQQQATLIENRKKNIDLHFNSPNYKPVNPITYKNQPQPSDYKPHTKMTPFSNIDHLAGYPEPQNKRQLGNGQFQHLAYTSPNQTWKPCQKKIEFQPQPKKVERSQVKKTDYQDKYQRNPITEGEDLNKVHKDTYYGQKLLKQQALRQSAGNQNISDETKKFNAKKNGFDGERKKRQYNNFFHNGNTHTLNVHNQVQVSPKKVNVDFYKSKEVNIAIQLNTDYGVENRPERQKDVQIYQSKETNLATQHDPTLKSNQPLKEKNVDIYKSDKLAHQGQSSEVWPLRSDMPSKKSVKNNFAVRNSMDRTDVFSIMHYDYGMPHSKQFTEKVNRVDPGKKQFTQNNDVDYRRKYNVLQKEEVMATRNVSNIILG